MTNTGASDPTAKRHSGDEEAATIFELQRENTRLKAKLQEVTELMQDGMANPNALDNRNITDFPFDASNPFDVSVFPAGTLLEWLTKYCKEHNMAIGDSQASEEFARVVDELLRRDELLRHLVRRSIEMSPGPFTTP